MQIWFVAMCGLLLYTMWSMAADKAWTPSKYRGGRRMR